MISDLYPPEKRATAVVIYSSGISIGILIGFIVGGWIDQHFGLRTALFVVGIPGVFYALLLFYCERTIKGTFGKASGNLGRKSFIKRSAFVTMAKQNL